MRKQQRGKAALVCFAVIGVVDENGADFISNLIYKQQMKTKGLCLA